MKCCQGEMYKKTLSFLGRSTALLSQKDDGWVKDLSLSPIFTITALIHTSVPSAQIPI